MQAYTKVILVLALICLTSDGVGAREKRLLNLGNVLGNTVGNLGSTVGNLLNNVLDLVSDVVQSLANALRGGPRGNLSGTISSVAMELVQSVEVTQLGRVVREIHFDLPQLDIKLLVTAVALYLPDASVSFFVTDVASILSVIDLGSVLAQIRLKLDIPAFIWLARSVSMQLGTTLNNILTAVIQNIPVSQLADFVSETSQFLPCGVNLNDLVTTAIRVNINWFGGPAFVFTMDNGKGGQNPNGSSGGAAVPGVAISNLIEGEMGGETGGDSGEEEENGETETVTQGPPNFEEELVAV